MQERASELTMGALYLSITAIAACSSSKCSSMHCGWSGAGDKRRIGLGSAALLRCNFTRKPTQLSRGSGLLFAKQCTMVNKPYARLLAPGLGPCRSSFSGTFWHGPGGDFVVRKVCYLSTCTTYRGGRRLTAPCRVFLHHGFDCSVLGLHGTGRKEGSWCAVARERLWLAGSALAGSEQGRLKRWVIGPAGGYLV